MPIKGPSGGGEQDLEKILAQLLAGASADEVLDTLPAPEAASAAPASSSLQAGDGAAGGAAATGPRSDANAWEKFSASGMSKTPVQAGPMRGAAVHARIMALKK